MRWIHCRQIRHTLSAAFVLILLFYFLASRRSSVYNSKILVPFIDTHDLPIEEQSKVLGAQFAVAEDVYRNMLIQRQELIKHHGPTPDRILLSASFHLHYLILEIKFHIDFPQIRNLGRHTLSVSISRFYL